MAVFLQLVALTCAAPWIPVDVIVLLRSLNFWLLEVVVMARCERWAEASLGSLDNPVLSVWHLWLEFALAVVFNLGSP